MNDRFTARAINALQYAQEEARRLSQNYVGTEHLLLGIMRDGDGIAARALDDFGLDIDDVRDVVANYTGAEETSTPDNPYYTPRAKHVLELAYEAAGSLGHNYIGTEHLLLGIVAEQRGIAARVLGAFGLSA
ncbi:MAG: ATP-dependent Clp protease ATP-binding subunit ClpC, partial [Veillonellaceae bacterium]|nr:ATP-dependent Clp protease ATP-binding subunit ClpC [Veillonellaceae bacterium]